MKSETLRLMEQRSISADEIEKIVDCVRRGVSTELALVEETKFANNAVRRVLYTLYDLGVARYTSEVKRNEKGVMWSTFYWRIVDGESL